MNSSNVSQAAAPGVPADVAAAAKVHLQRRPRGPLLAALALVAASALSLFPPSIEWDGLNVLSVAATAYLGWRLVQSRARPWVKSLVFLLLLGTAVEFSLRVFSYQRALIYERQGNLLFTPTPNQTYIEKVSLSASRIDERGMRAPSAFVEGRTTILALGDSITYGYGIADQDTWPAQLAAALERAHPGRFNILNGGVNAYPMTFIHQKFLYHWNRGLRPDVVIVGYSMNEGWLGHLVEADEAVKAQFESRVVLKNVLRSSALYNLIVENWARRTYEALRYKLVPGTNSTTISSTDLRDLYDQYLDRFVADLRARNVKPVFLLFAALNGETFRYDTLGPFQKRFAAFAESHGIPLLRTDDVFRDALGGDPNLTPFFFDPGHMTERGNLVLARKLAEWLPPRIAGSSDIESEGQ